MVTKGIEYLVDRKGHKKSVVISLKNYQRLMEDLHDLKVAVQRRNERGISLDDVEKKLTEAGHLPRRVKTKRRERSSKP